MLWRTCPDSGRPSPLESYNYVRAVSHLARPVSRVLLHGQSSGLSATGFYTASGFSNRQRTLDFGVMEGEDRLSPEPQVSDKLRNAGRKLNYAVCSQETHTRKRAFSLTEEIGVEEDSWVLVDCLKGCCCSCWGSRREEDTDPERGQRALARQKRSACSNCLLLLDYEIVQIASVCLMVAMVIALFIMLFFHFY